MSLPSSTLDKRVLRRSLLDTRRSISEEQLALWNAAISDRLEQCFDEHPVATLGVFWPINKEPDLRGLYEKLSARGVRLSLPVVVGKDQPLRFAAWIPGDAMVQDSFGVSVPEQPVFGATPEALLIPCVGFNAQRFRIGYGGGFYDRTLAGTPRPLAIGIAYACLQADFGTEAHDIALDMMVTD